MVKVPVRNDILGWCIFLSEIINVRIITNDLIAQEISSKKRADGHWLKKAGLLYVLATLITSRFRCQLSPKELFYRYHPKSYLLIPTNQLQQLIRRNLTTHIRPFQQTICQIAFLMV